MFSLLAPLFTSRCFYAPLRSLSIDNSGGGDPRRFVVVFGIVCDMYMSLSIHIWIEDGHNLPFSTVFTH